MTSSYEAARKKNIAFVKRNNLRDAECCLYCYHSKRQDRVIIECSLLIWEVGNRVNITDICNQFVRKRE
jgi:hypothetical protein